jgi:hypothetical protein
MRKASRRLTLAPGAALGRKSGSTPSGETRRNADRNMAGVAGGDCSERTLTQQGNRSPLFTHSAPVGNRIVGRFWALETENGDDEDEISNPTTEEFIAAAS